MELKLGFADGTSRVFDLKSVASIVLRAAITGATFYYSYKLIERIASNLDPTSKDKKRAELKANEILTKLGRPDLKDLQLTDYEVTVASQLIVPKDMAVSWQDIGGLDHIVTKLKETVILPIQRQDLFSESKLFSPPKGILLYGPPGCGKTMLAKATAKEAGCTFINIELQQLTNKWYGESQKLAAAVFSLASKLQPSIIFIDEIDVFLQMRSDRDHEVTAMMKATFMSLWDGLVSAKSNRIMVMGATNRPRQIDQAILRRLPIRLHVKLPNHQQRHNILQLILKVEKVDNSCDLWQVAKHLEGLSGSDIDEVCRQASVARVHEHISLNAGDLETKRELRPISQDDLLKAARVILNSKKSHHFGINEDLQFEVDSQD